VDLRLAERLMGSGGHTDDNSGDIDAVGGLPDTLAEWR